MASNGKLKLNKFDMTKIGENKVIVFIGKRNSGKSQLVLDLLSHNLDIPIGMVISPTDNFNGTFQGKVPDIFIHSEITPELLQSFLDRQEKRTMDAKKNPSIDPRAFLILDDCLADAQMWINDRSVKYIFMNGRHVNVTLIITLQDPVGIPPRLRTNVDYVFICKETTKANRRKIHEMYAGVFPDCRVFEDTMLQVCDKFNCLVINKNSQSYRLEDQVFWYRANLNRTSSFKICHPLYWKANEEMKKKKQQIDADKEKEQLMKSQSRKGDYTIVRRLEQTVENIQ